MLELVEAVDEEVAAEFRRGFRARAALAAVRQARVNEACREFESRLIDGVGQLAYRIDADLYWAARLKYGKDCWSHGEFVEDCVRRGTIERVRGRSDRVISTGRRAA